MTFGKVGLKKSLLLWPGREQAGLQSHFCSTCGLTRTGECGHGLLHRLTLAGHSFESLVTGSVPETQGDWRSGARKGRDVITPGPSALLHSYLCHSREQNIPERLRAVRN